MLTLKPSDLRPTSKNQVKFRAPTKKQVNHDTKSKSISARTQIHFDPPHKNKLISRPLQSNQFDLHSQIKSISMPGHKTKLASTQKLAPSIFRPQQKKQVNSDPDTELKSSSTPHTEIKLIPTTHTKT